MIKKNVFKSVRAKLFLTLCIVIFMIIFFFIVINNTVLETLYFHSKKEASLNVFNYINENLPKTSEELNAGHYYSELEKLEVKDNFEILVLDEDKVLYATNKNFLSDFGKINDITYDIEYSIFNKTDIMYSKDNVSIRKIVNRNNGFSYILVDSILKNGNMLYIRTPIEPIQESVSLSNRFIYVLGFAAIILGGIAIVFITERFTKPIEELNDIANEMAKLNFKRKYRINDSKDEIDELGKSINTLSDKLEETINQLKINNSELEKDIEAKSKIDEMRKQFISDVSHELKTPIALIQGYAEGLVENVTTDEESRKFYTEVILDEANKMDKLVKRLLELMKLEYEDRKFNDEKFDIVELINSVVKNSKVVLTDKKIKVDFIEENPIYVFADEFYIEQVITNYFTNAIKNVEEVDKIKEIKISIKKSKDLGKYRVSVFNTGKRIDEENLNRIWNRFYKVDSARTRSKGGTGIGLALVKAIMTKYNNAYGVKNKKNGVEFYFEVQESK